MTMHARGAKRLNDSSVDAKRLDTTIAMRFSF
jgi:hypothetical protein